jgi:hypothetical protein
MRSCAPDARGFACRGKNPAGELQYGCERRQGRQELMKVRANCSGGEASEGEDDRRSF